MNSDISLPSHRENRFYQGPAATFVANALQAVNFLGDRFLRPSHHPFTAIEDLYRHSMDSAFSLTESFLVTGAPHASAYYPRDFAWFYPDVLDPNTGEVTTRKGGFAVMSQLLSSGPETKDYLKKGHLTLAEEIRYSVEGAGTNEERLKSVTKGRTKDEIKKAPDYNEKRRNDTDERKHQEDYYGPFTASGSSR